MGMSLPVMTRIGCCTSAVREEPERSVESRDLACERRPWCSARRVFFCHCSGWAAMVVG